VKISEPDLKHLIKSKGFTLDDFAKQLDITRQGLYHLMMRPYVKPATIEKICKVLSVDKEEFLEPEKVKQNVNENVTRETSKGNIVFVPVTAQGGFLAGYRSPIFIQSLEHFRLPGVTGEHYAFEISGMSMYKPDDEKSAKTGDIAISRPVEQATHMSKGKGYILQAIDGILYKEFDKIENNVGYFNSINPEYDGHELPLKSIKKIYFVDFILKKSY